jgi:hypothetical protein
LIGSCRKDRICIEPALDGLSVTDAELKVVRNIESILNCGDHQKQSSIATDVTAEEFATYLNNVIWE